MSNLQNPLALNSINPLGFWDSAIGALSRELSPQQFKTWIQPLVFLSFEDSERILTVGAPNRFKLDWIKKTFADRFQELASEYFDQAININFVLAVEAPAPIRPAPAIELLPAELPPDGETGSAVLVEEQSFEIEDHSKLNPNLTFETFVTGKANQLARAASIQVAHNPGTSYNPMFLYGGVGLGKTH
jgi:chromosomal replication initiator protein